jgi:hypothetical protein
MATATIHQPPPVFKAFDYDAISRMQHVAQSVRNLAYCWLCIDHPRYAAWMAGLRRLLENGREVMACDDHARIVVDGEVRPVEWLDGHV